MENYIATNYNIDHIKENLPAINSIPPLPQLLDELGKMLNKIGDFYNRIEKGLWTPMSRKKMEDENMYEVGCKWEQIAKVLLDPRLP